MQLAKTDVLLLDDWGLALLTDSARRDPLKIFDDRHGHRSTIVTSQLYRWRTGTNPSATQPWQMLS